MKIFPFTTNSLKIKSKPTARSFFGSPHLSHWAAKRSCISGSDLQS